MTTATITLDVCTPEGKTWLALVTGVDQKFGFQRDFVGTIDKHLSGSGKTGTYIYAVEDGIYESNEGRKRYGRRYWRVQGGTVTAIDRDEALAAV
jgi:hypothetical protein